MSLLEMRASRAVMGPLSFAVALLLSADPAGAATRAPGKVGRVQGTVEVFRAAFPGRGWRPASGGMDFFEGDLLRTGRDGSAKITFYSATGQDTIDVAPDTYLEVPVTGPGASASGTMAGALVELKQGLLRWWSGEPPPAGRPPMPFNVRTPTVVLGTRDRGVGCEAAIRHHPGDQRTDVLVGRGTATVTGRLASSSRSVRAGEKVSGTRGGVSPPTRLAAGEWAEVTERLGRTAPPGACAGILGSWRWPVGTATFSGDPTGGTAAASGNPHVSAGTWRCVGPNRVEIVWNAGRFIDRMTVSGDAMSGTNQSGYSIKAARSGARR